MARLMLSAGMFSDFAARIAVRSRGFISGSPPDFAAIAISLIRRVKILPRLASSAPFLCLIVAHFECPDIAIPHVYKQNLIAQILGIMDPPAEEITDQPRRKNVQAKGDYSTARTSNPCWSIGDLLLDVGRCSTRKPIFSTPAERTSSTTLATQLYRALASARM